MAPSVSNYIVLYSSMNALRASILLYRYGPFYIANRFFLMQSTLKGVKIHYLTDPGGLDGSNTIQLGGAYSTHLCGPTPACLVLGNIPAVAPQVLQPLPRFTSTSEQALDMNNWRIHP